jgi:hypothetical protein
LQLKRRRKGTLQFHSSFRLHDGGTAWGARWRDPVGK